MLVPVALCSSPSHAFVVSDLEPVLGWGAPALVLDVLPQHRQDPILQLEDHKHRDATQNQRTVLPKRCF